MSSGSHLKLILMYLIIGDLVKDSWNVRNGRVALHIELEGTDEG